MEVPPAPQQQQVFEARPALAVMDDADRFVGPTAPQSWKRFVRVLVPFLRRASWVASASLGYWNDRLRGEPLLVTESECRDFLDKPENERAAWLQRQSEATGFARGLVAAELFARLLGQRETYLMQALDAPPEAQWRAELASAQRCLTLIDWLIDSAALLDFAVGSREIEMMCRQFRQWAPFTNDRRYVDARQGERAVLAHGLARLDEAAAIRLMVELGFYVGSIHTDSAEEDALLSEVLSVLEPHAVRRTRRRFEREPGIASLGMNHFDAALERYYLFTVDSKLYDGAGRQFLGELAERARLEVTIQRNFWDFLRILSRGIEGQPHIDASRRFLEERNLVRLLWAGATARPVQVRMLGDLRRMRTILSTAGDELPVPEWLEPNPPPRAD
jgi:hypothetical protein